ncbi:MAG: hypothetical protein AB7V32_07695 [Candidatus Berkiella sp.]
MQHRVSFEVATHELKRILVINHKKIGAINMTYKYLKQFVTLAALGMCTTSMANGTLYLNNFGGKASVNNTSPSGSGLMEPFGGFLPAPNPADCKNSLIASGITFDCTTQNTPSAAPLGNILTDIQGGVFNIADPNNPSAPAVFSTNDPVLTFEIRLSYKHDVHSQAAVNQASYYQTDVDDSRLGWGFIAVTSSDSPANLCMGITANKLIAFVDGVSQDPDNPGAPGFAYVSLKEIADYVPGSVVDVKIVINKANKTGTYIINGVKKLTINLAGKLPDTNQLKVTKVVVPKIPAGNSLEGWSFGISPVNSNLNLASVGAASDPNCGTNGSYCRYDIGGLVNNQFDATLFPLFFGGGPYTEVFPAAYLHPNGSWAPENCQSASCFAFGTNYQLTINKVKVYSRSQTSPDDGG